ncbi:MAG: Fe-S protein assembly co-chaperone HscB [Burkholderiales bacterium]|jgi:molecular chaperone HscB|nr:Fe-S protein assembly co-chaperone HscB [Burkholderiales bacterium]
MDRKADFFSLFGLPCRYALDETVLNESYRTLLARVHPDTVALADVAAKRRAIEEAAYVNDAYRVLKNPVRRGDYLLQCHGEAPLGVSEVLPVEFLNEQLEAREAADTAWQAGDADRLEALWVSLEEEQQQRQQALAALFADDETPSKAALAQARQHVLSLQFLARFADDLSEKMDA